MSGSTVAKGDNSRKTKAQLIDDLGRLQRRVDELELVADEGGRVERLLSEPAVQLKSILEHAPILISLKDAQGRYVLGNQQFRMSYGLTDEEVEGRLPHDLFPKEFADSVVAHDLAVLETGQTIEREIVEDRVDGVRTFLAVKFPILGASGEVTGVGGIATDITERKRAEEALRESEEALARAQRQARIGSWRWSVERDDLVSCSEEYARIHGVGMHEVHALIKHQLERIIHPDDRERVEREFKRVDDEGVDYEIEYRIVNPDGEVRHVVEVGEAILDVLGQVVEQTGTVQDITGRKRMEDALRQSEARYKELFQSAAVSLWEEDWSAVKPMIDSLKQQGVTDFHQYFREHPEFVAKASVATILMDVNLATVEAYRARNSASLIDEINDRNRSEPFEGFADRLAAFAEGAHRVSGELRNRRSDGSEFYEHMTETIPEAYRDDWSRLLGTTEDITERKQAEEALRRAHDELELRVEERTGELQAANEALRKNQVRLQHAHLIANLAYWEWEPREDRLHCSPDIAAIFGVSQDRLPKSDLDFLAFVHPEDRDRVVDVLENCATRLTDYSLDFRIIRADGEVRNIHERGEPVVDEAGKVLHVAGTTQDITERKQLERQLIQSSKLAVLGEMAAGLAHEFSQPLNIIRLASESALILMEEDEADADRQRKQFEKINGQAQRMIEIVNHVNSFARVDVGEPKPFDPVRCIEDAIAMASDHFGTDDVVITTRMPRSCSQVLGHRVRLEQVIVNLLNNARDATLTIRQRKPGALSKGEIAVEVADNARKDTIHVLVTDNSGGIPPDLIKSIFEPFFTTKPIGRGTGLGLSISADIIADMGGTIEVKNVEGGARFEIALPVYVEGG